MARAVTFEVDGALARWTMARSHGNAINGDLLDGLVECCRQASADDRVRAVTLAASGKLFCPGLDLQELIELDRPAMEQFVARFNACILELYTFPKPVVAAIHGHAVAGGCVLSLTADWRVLKEGTTVGLNEVKVGVPFPFGVATILREAALKVEEVALFGRNYVGQEAVAAGLVHEVTPAGDFESRCRERTEELAAKDPTAFAITKRYLRAAAVEHIRAHDAELMHEFIDAWFSPQTRERLTSIVDGLKKRK